MGFQNGADATVCLGRSVAPLRQGDRRRRDLQNGGLGCLVKWFYIKSSVEKENKIVIFYTKGRSLTERRPG